MTKKEEENEFGDNKQSLPQGVLETSSMHTYLEERG